MVLVTASIFTACHKAGNKQSKYIPKDAYMVFSLNTKSIFSKVNKANFSVDSLVNMFEDNKDSAKKALAKYDDIKNAGIDFDQPVLAFLKTGGSIMMGNSFSGAFVLSIKSAADYEAFLKKENPGKDIKKGDNYSYMALGNDFVAGWNDEVAILASKSGGNSAPGTYATGEGTLAQQLLTTLFAQKESESISSVKGYEEMAGKTADMAFFLNSEAMPANPMISMSKASDLLKGTYAIGTADFEDGKIVMSFTGHLSDALSDLYKKYPLRAIDVSMIDKYPGNVQGFVVSAFDPQLIAALLNYIGVDVLANQYLQQGGINLTVADICKAFKGDFAIVGGDFAMQSKTITEMGGYKLPEPTTSQVPSYKMVSNITIDKAGYNKVASVFAEKGILVQQNGQYVFPGLNNSGFVMNTTDNNLYFASGADVLQQYTAGSGKNNLPGDVHDKIKGKVFAMYFDINGVISAIPAGTGEQASLDNAKSVFKYMLFTGDKTEGKESTGNAELVLTNDKENSLVTFLRYAQHQSAIEKQRRASYMPGMTDSTATMDTIPPPPPPAK